MGQDLTIIDASATKDFFISILVRDIDLAEAIVDLVDNSVDGARKLRGGNDLSNLYVQLDLSGNRFSITDNCGGIETVVARKYAFRFGRDTNDPPPMTKHTVGQFGVGMKRAIFKLGNNIEIKSSAKNSIFTVNLNVATWKQKLEWDLTFNTLQENLTQTEENLGTSIVITELNEGPSQEIVLGSFHTKLKNMIESAHAESINKGFEIKIGVHTLSGLHPKMIRSAEIVPLNKTVSFFEKSNTPVTVRIYAGVSDSGPAEAGWYVICNGRTILAANQDSIRHSNEVLPELAWIKKTILWLDYDGKLNQESLSDIAAFFASAPSGSAFVISINSEFDKFGENSFQQFEDSVGKENIPIGVGVKDMRGNGSAQVLRQIIINQIEKILSYRNGVLLPKNQLKFEQLFNFQYADGAKMLTVGGILFKNSREAILKKSDPWGDIEFIRRSDEPYVIDAPCLTLKEIRYLESLLPIGTEKQKKYPLIPKEQHKKYSKVYRYYPMYAAAEL